MATIYTKPIKERCWSCKREWTAWLPGMHGLYCPLCTDLQWRYYHGEPRPITPEVQAYIAQCEQSKE
jgi:hypothetical protein